MSTQTVLMLFTLVLDIVPFYLEQIILKRMELLEKICEAKGSNNNTHIFVTPPNKTQSEKIGF